MNYPFITLRLVGKLCSYKSEESKSREGSREINMLRGIVYHQNYYRH